MSDIRLGPSTKVARRCACQGWIIATPHSSEVPEAVERHRKEEPHRSWDPGPWVDAHTINTVVRRVDKAA